MWKKSGRCPTADEKQRAARGRSSQVIAGNDSEYPRSGFQPDAIAVLGDFGLEAALKLLAEQTALSSGIEVVFTGTKEAARLTPVQEIGLYRIAQEGLNNAVKYAEAERIEVVYKRSDFEVCLFVKDNGKGFKVAEISEAGNLFTGAQRFG